MGPAHETQTYLMLRHERELNIFAITAKFASPSVLMLLLRPFLQARTGQFPSLSSVSCFPPSLLGMSGVWSVGACGVSSGGAAVEVVRCDDSGRLHPSNLTEPVRRDCQTRLFVAPRTTYLFQLPATHLTDTLLARGTYIGKLWGTLEQEVVLRGRWFD